jgi:thioesterase domain-containing protein
MPLARYMPADYPVYGLQAPGLDGTSPLSASLEEMAAGHVEQIRALQETGPYYLLGWSFGGVVAHEIAVQLQAAGQQVHLIIMDGYPPDHGADPASGGPDGDPAANVPGTGSSAGEEASADDLPPAEIVSRLREEWGYMLAGLSDEELMISVRILQNNRRLALRHSFGEFTGDTFLIVAAKGRGEGDTPAAAWRPYIPGEILESWLPCGHMEMAQPEMLAQVWDRISTWLQRKS